jgi:hypothetical protein
MIINNAMALAMAAACLAVVATTPAAQAQAQRRPVTVKHAPITSPGDVSDSESARRNVAESDQYERLLRKNPAFRRVRMQKECGGIADPELHQSCLASFDQR